MATINEVISSAEFEESLSACIEYVQSCVLDYGDEFKSMSIEDLFASIGTPSKADMHNEPLMNETNAKMKYLGWRGTTFSPSGNQSEKNALEFFQYCSDGKIIICGLKDPNKVIVFKVVSNEDGTTTTKEQLRCIEF